MRSVCVTGLEREMAGLGWVQELASAAWSLAKLHVTPEPALVAALYASARERLPDFAPTNLAALLWAATQLGTVRPHAARGREGKGVSCWLHAGTGGGGHANNGCILAWTTTHVE